MIILQKHESFGSTLSHILQRSLRWSSLHKGLRLSVKTIVIYD